MDRTVGGDRTGQAAETRIEIKHGAIGFCQCLSDGLTDQCLAGT